MRKRGLLLVLSGPAGSGKSTLAERAAAADPSIVRTLTATTRPPREGEVDGRDYLFLSEEEFQKRIRAGWFLEHAVFNGKHYGTPRHLLDEHLDQNRVAVLVIDVQGAAQVRASSFFGVHVFVLPPTPGDLRQRLCGRGTECVSEIERRLEIATREIGRIEEYDYLLINDDEEAATRDLLEIIEVARRHRLRGGEEEMWQAGYFRGWHGT